mgnify:CR=1 FL=1
MSLPAFARRGPVLALLLPLLTAAGCGGEDSNTDPGVDAIANFRAHFDTATTCAGGPVADCFACCQSLGFDRSRYETMTSECGCTYNVMDDQICADAVFGESCTGCCESANVFYQAFNGGGGACLCRRPSKTPPGS